MPSNWWSPRQRTAISPPDGLALTTKELAAAEEADPPPSVHDDNNDHKSHAVHDVIDAMLVHEATAILNLHIEAVAV